jgi:outer membrane protein OmpA-like peptidoglycan-associated protein
LLASARMNRLLALAPVVAVLPLAAGVARAQPVSPPPVVGPELVPPDFAVPRQPPAPHAPAAPAPAPAPLEVDAPMPPTPAPPVSLAAARGPGAAPDTLVSGPSVVSDETVETSGAAPRRAGLPSLDGSAGLLRARAANLGPPGELRLALYGEYARASSFLIDGSRTRRLAGSLAASLAVLRRLEVFAALLASSSRNDRCATGEAGCRVEPDRTDPPVIRAFGDLLAGAKVAAAVTGPLHLGAEAGLHLYADSQGQAFDGDATSGWVSALGTVDLRRVSGLPLLLHLNLGYVADNSSNLLDDPGLARAPLSSRTVSAFAYGVGHSRARAALAVAAPLARDSGLAWEPFVEYHAQLATDGADPAFAAYTRPNCRVGNPCADNRDLHWMTFGMRAQTAGGFALVAGVDLGLRSPGYAYGSQLLPYNLVFGVGHALSADRPRPRLVTRTVTMERVVARAPVVHEGFLAGRVLGPDGVPIAGAAVGAAGASRARVATDADGGFVSKGLPAGELSIEVTAPGFEPQVRTARIVAGQTGALEVTLSPAAAPPAPAPAVEAPAPPVVPVPAPVPVPVPAPVPAPAAGRNVRLDNGRVILRRPIAFRVSDDQPTAELEPAARTALDEVAAYLARHPDVTQLRVEAHWDNTLGAAEAEALTRRQAEAVVQHLVTRGVARERLLATGLGASRPRVPNLGPTSRAQNRRVELLVGR